MIAGTAPYSTDSAFSIMMKHVSAPVVDLREVWPECPATLAAVLVKMMQKSPTNRQQSYDHLLAELKYAYENLDEPSAAQQAETSEAPTEPQGAYGESHRPNRCGRGDARDGRDNFLHQETPCYRRGGVKLCDNFHLIQVGSPVANFVRRILACSLARLGGGRDAGGLGRFE